MVVWENSDKVKEKDLAHLRKLLAEAGYIALWDKVDAKLYSCQSRPMIYLIAFLSTSMKAAAVDGPISEENLDAAVSRSWLPEVFRTLASLGGPSPPLDDYLLPDDHEEVREWTAHRMAVKTEADNKKKATRSCSDLNFESQHLEFYSTEGFTWPPTQAMLEAAGLADKLAHLPRRNQETAYYHTMCKRSKEYVSEKMFDLNMNLEWQLHQPTVGCLVCTAKPWLLKRRRELTGAEALTIQGFAWWEIRHSDTRYKNTDMLHLAGNAMSGYVFGSTHHQPVREH